MSNLFSEIPKDIPNEIFEDIITTQNVRIERIVSKGQSSPVSSWYDQDEHEWVLVLSGQGVIGFEDGSEVILNPGDYINIAAHQKHKVIRTSSDEATVWLAVFYY